MNITVQKSGQVLSCLSLERGPILIGSGLAVQVSLPLASIPKRQAVLLQDAKGRWYLEEGTYRAGPQTNEWIIPE